LFSKEERKQKNSKLHTEEEKKRNRQRDKQEICKEKNNYHILIYEPLTGLSRPVPVSKIHLESEQAKKKTD
jgi:hypothetical protein